MDAHLGGRLLCRSSRRSISARGSTPPFSTGVGTAANGRDAFRTREFRADSAAEVSALRVGLLRETPPLLVPSDIQQRAFLSCRLFLCEAFRSLVRTAR